MAEAASAPPGHSELGLLQKLSSLFRTYAIPKHSLVVPRPFRRDDRNSFNFLVPAEWTSDEEGRSSLVLLEDGQSLGPAGCGHDDIRTLGRGRYSHWGPKVYFSSSDNSNPNSNGRVYSLLPPSGWTRSRKETFRERIVPVPSEQQAAECAPEPELEPGSQVSVEWSVTDIEPGSVGALAGHAYVLPMPDDWASDRESLSTLMLLEDGRPLARPHAPHREIETLGRGRYSHWDGELRFAASDNSDPRGNGRCYAVARAAAFLFQHALQPPQAESGHCWILDSLPTEWSSDAEGRSRLLLLEDGKLLGPAHASHDEIRSAGNGRFCHWGRQLWFSTSDNSDPTANGRTYTVVWQDLDDD